MANKREQISVSNCRKEINKNILPFAFIPLKDLLDTYAKLHIRVPTG